MTEQPETTIKPADDPDDDIDPVSLACSLLKGDKDAAGGVVRLLCQARLGELRGMLPERGSGPLLARIVAADLAVRDLEGDLTDLVALMEGLPAGSWRTWIAAIIAEHLAWQVDPMATAVATLALASLGDIDDELDLLNRGRLRRALATMHILSGAGGTSATSRGLLRQAIRDFRAVGAVEEEQATVCLAGVFVALTDPARADNQLALVLATLAGGTVPGSDRGPAGDYMLAWSALLAGDVGLPRAVADRLTPLTWRSAVGRESIARLREAIANRDPVTGSAGTQEAPAGAQVGEIVALAPDLKVRRNGIPVPVGHSGAWLLAVLAAKGPRPVATEWLTERLWPVEDHDVRRRRLNNLTHRLRRRLGALPGELLVRSGDTLQLLPSASVRVDVWDFRTLAAGTVPERKRALELYASDLCARQFAYDDCLEAERNELRDLWTDTALGLLVEDEMSARDIVERCRALGETPPRLAAELAIRLHGEGMQASAALLADEHGLTLRGTGPDRLGAPRLGLVPPSPA